MIALTPQTTVTLVKCSCWRCPGGEERRRGEGRLDHGRASLGFSPYTGVTLSHHRRGDAEGQAPPDAGEEQGRCGVNPLGDRRPPAGWVNAPDSRGGPTPPGEVAARHGPVGLAPGRPGRAIGMALSLVGATGPPAMPRLRPGPTARQEWDTTAWGACRLVPTNSAATTDWASAVIRTGAGTVKDHVPAGPMLPLSSPRAPCDASHSSRASEDPQTNKAEGTVLVTPRLGWSSRFGATVMLPQSGKHRECMPFACRHPGSPAGPGSAGPSATTGAGVV